MGRTIEIVLAALLLAGCAYDEPTSFTLGDKLVLFMLLGWIAGSSLGRRR